MLKNVLLTRLLFFSENKGGEKMRKVIILAILFCFCFPFLVSANEIAPTLDQTKSQSGSGIEPVSIDTVIAKVNEAEGYIMGAASPIIKLLSKIMLLFIALSLIVLLLTGAKAAKNALIALIFVGVGIVIFTAIPQLTEWFVNIGNWLVN